MMKRVVPTEPVGNEVSLKMGVSACSTGNHSLSDEDEDNCGLDSMPPPPDGGWGWVVVFASFMCNVIVDGIIFSFGILLSDIAVDLNTSKGITAWIVSLQAGCYLMIGPVVSGLANRYGCRTVTISGSFIASFGFVLSYWADSVFFLTLSFGVIGGIGFGFIYLPAIVTVGHYFEKKRALATGLAVCGSGIGTFVMGFVFQFLIAHFGWRGCVLILSGLILTCVLFGSLFRPVEMPLSIPEKPLLSESKEDKRDKEPSKVNPHWGPERTNSVSKVTGLKGIDKEVIRPLRPLIPSTDPVKEEAEEEEEEEAEAVVTIRKQKKGDKDNEEEEEGEDDKYDEYGQVMQFSSRDNSNKNSPHPYSPVMDGGISGSRSSRHSMPELNKGANLLTHHLHLHRSTGQRTSSIGSTDGMRPPRLRPRTFTDHTKPNGRNDIFVQNMNLPSVFKPDFLYDPLSKGTSNTEISRKISRAESIRSRTRSMRLGSIGPGTIASLVIAEDILPPMEEEPFCAPFMEELRNTIDKELIYSPTFFLLALSGFLTLAGFFIPFVFIVDRAVLLGLTKEQGGRLISIIGVTNTLGRVFCGWISDQPQADALVITNWALVLGGLTTLLSPIICTSFLTLSVFCSIFGFSIACFAALRSVIAVELFGVDKLTNAFGLLLLPQGIATIIGTPFAGWLYDVSGSYDNSFYVAGTVIMISGLMCLPLKRIVQWEKTRRQP